MEETDGPQAVKMLTEVLSACGPEERMTLISEIKEVLNDELVRLSRNLRVRQRAQIGC